ncbi:MAG TPA: hypothetical protein DCX41_05190 [Aequorivita sp.]|nr:hypothetical protein [Pusillimonas sp.]HAV54313.1 hypothetical protein [Aequorivita sp.]|tara:strand:+ start:18732 stop:19391 length:660 start_codon:yes stop_codon:yes gene_type:complete
MNNVLENDKKFLEVTQELWDFLCPRQELDSVEVDAIFVFGGIGDEIPLHAASLYNERVSDKILVTGNSGKYTKDVFKEPEALVFKKAMIENGVKESDIIVELDATNAGENVRFGYELLRKELENSDHLVLVCRSFMTRRAIATFKKEFPAVVCYASPPRVNILDTVNRSRYASAQRLIAELERLENYYEQGFISKVNIPKTVREAEKALKEILGKIEES